MEHFINDDSDREYFWIDRKFQILEGFWSHVKGRSGVHFIEIFVVKMDRKTKISDDGFPLFKENVLWFKVSMDNFLGV